MRSLKIRRLTVQILIVKASRDFGCNIMRANPVPALSELIWKAFDADAKRLDVWFEYNGLDIRGAILVEDDGEGLPRCAAESCFTSLSTSNRRCVARCSAFWCVTGGRAARRRSAGICAKRSRASRVAVSGNRYAALGPRRRFRDFSIMRLRGLLGQIGCRSRRAPRVKTGGQFALLRPPLKREPIVVIFRWEINGWLMARQGADCGGGEFTGFYAEPSPA